MGKGSNLVTDAGIIQLGQVFGQGQIAVALATDLYPHLIFGQVVCRVKKLIRGANHNIICPMRFAKAIDERLKQMPGQPAS